MPVHGMVRTAQGPRHRSQSEGKTARVPYRRSATAGTLPVRGDGIRPVPADDKEATMSTRRHMKVGILAALAALAALLVFGTGSALAAAPGVVGPGDGPFLCPSVGAGYVNNHPDAGQLPSGDYTFLPGNNQAGAHANANALNTLPAGESPGPGDGNSDWSPIWPY